MNAAAIPTIRVNLLPHRELARAARQRQFVSMLLLTLILAGAAVAAGQVVFSGMRAAQQSRNQFLEAEIAKLDAQIAEIRKLKDETQALLERKRVVEVLQTNRGEVVHLFDELARRLPDGVHLKSVKQSGDTIAISGYAQSQARVSTLMRNLDESPWLEQPRVVEIKAVTVNNLQSNEFSLSVVQTARTPQEPDA
jgi:type IV pilus assembly protein PilN